MSKRVRPPLPRNGSRYGGVPASVSLTSTPAIEKSNITRCDSVRVFGWKTARFDGLMSRWVTPARSSAATAVSRSVPQRCSTSIDSRRPLLSSSANVVRPAKFSSSAVRPPTSTTSCRVTMRAIVLEAGQHLGLGAQPLTGLGFLATLSTRSAPPTCRSSTRMPTAVEPAPRRRL